MVITFLLIFLNELKVGSYFETTGTTCHVLGVRYSQYQGNYLLQKVP